MWNFLWNISHFWNISWQKYPTQEIFLKCEMFHEIFPTLEIFLAPREIFVEIFPTWAIFYWRNFQLRKYFPCESPKSWQYLQLWKYFFRFFPLCERSLRQVSHGKQKLRIFLEIFLKLVIFWWNISKIRNILTKIFQMLGIFLWNISKVRNILMKNFPFKTRLNPSYFNCFQCYIFETFWNINLKLLLIFCVFFLFHTWKIFHRKVWNISRVWNIS